MKKISCAVILCLCIIKTICCMENKMHTAAWHKNMQKLETTLLQILKERLEKEEQEEKKNFNLSFLNAIHTRNTFTIKELINQKHVEINQELTEDGQTALHIAARNNDCNMLLFLLAMKASHRACTKNGLNPLHFAIAANALDAANMLLELGADVNSLTSESYTPLHIACMNNNIKAVYILLKNKANIFLRNNQNLEAIAHTTDHQIKVLINNHRQQLINRCQMTYSHPKKHYVPKSPINQERHFSH